MNYIQDKPFLGTGGFMNRNIFLLIILISLLMADFPSGADYLIICPDAYQTRFEEFAQWKTRKGYVTRIAPLSETGSSATAIRSYIQNAYNTWEPAPRFVLI